MPDARHLLTLSNVPEMTEAFTALADAVARLGPDAVRVLRQFPELFTFGLDDSLDWRSTPLGLVQVVPERVMPRGQDGVPGGAPFTRLAVRPGPMFATLALCVSSALDPSEVEFCGAGNWPVVRLEAETVCAMADRIRA